MAKPNVTINEQAACLRILKAATRPMTAANIAVRLGLGGCRETRRRHVRLIIEGLRDLGSLIVATKKPAGYGIAKDESVYKEYLIRRFIEAKRVFGDMHKRKKMLVESNGQGMLFEPQRISVGCASVAVV